MIIRNQETRKMYLASLGKEKVFSGFQEATEYVINKADKELMSVWEYEGLFYAIPYAKFDEAYMVGFKNVYTLQEVANVAFKNLPEQSLEEIDEEIKKEVISF